MTGPLDVETPAGLARVLVRSPPGGAPAGALVLGHGAGGSIGAPDLRAAARAALGTGWAVALVEQPYRVLGRRSAPPAARLDVAWLAVLDHLTDGPLAGLPLVTGGRSSGARVACRTAYATGSAGVLCLAFPLISPKGATRLPELEEVDVPVLVVQGASDRFGVPEPAGRRSVVVLRGGHGLGADLPGVEAAVRDWLPAQGPRI